MRHPIAPEFARSQAGFTLIELLVTIVIISILSSLMLAGLAGARQRVKIDKTKATIRKLDEVIIPLYNSYASRRVLATGVTRREQQLEALRVRRELMAYELPDTWDDVLSDYVIPHWANWPADPEPHLRTSAAARAYRAIRNAQAQVRGSMPSGESGECLFNVVTRSGLDPIAIELFRTDEIGDVDQDSMPEFIDGFGNAIQFIRWPMGFPSPLYSAASHDPMDPQQLDITLSNLLSGNEAVMVPLIASPGPDQELGLQSMNSWLAQSPAAPASALRPWRNRPPNPAGSLTALGNFLPGAPDSTAPGAAEDNVHNHSLKR